MPEEAREGIRSFDTVDKGSYESPNVSAGNGTQVL